MNGEIIQKELNRAHISQKELAHKIFVSPQAVSKWINNQSQPTFDNIKAMCEVFNTDLSAKLIASERRNRIKMKEHMLLKELNSFEQANKETELILDETEIREHYPYSIYILLKWLISAVIGLTYHQFLKQNVKELVYEDIFFNLNNYFEKCIIPNKFGNQLEYDFYLMGADLFESFEKSQKSNYEYCSAALDTWHRFKKAFSLNKEADLKLALIEIISSYSTY